MEKNAREKPEDSYFERYKILVAARNFHYENFNKWLTYFYVANAAIFLSYTTLASKEYPDENVLVIVMFLGYLAGLFLYWSSKGYYYWNLNFIVLVNYFERKVLEWEEDKSVYSMFANKKAFNNYSNITRSANFSTSKIAIFFSFIISFFWCFGLSFSILDLSYFTCLNFGNHKLWISLLSSILLTWGVTVLIGRKEYHFLASDVKPLKDLEIIQEDIDKSHHKED